MSRRQLVRLIARGLAVLAIAGGLAVFSAASPASAHAFLTDSNPADGAVLTEAPKTIRLAFSESVVIAATHIDVVDSQGHHYRPTRLRLIGDSADTEEPVQIVGDLPALPHSAYRVSWQTLSSDDLHTTSGVFVFGVDAAVSASAFVEPVPRAEEAALRWLLFACIGATLGGWLVLRLYRRSGGAAPQRCRRLAAVAPVGGALVAAGLLVDQLVSSGTSVGRLLGSEYGARWTLRELGFVMLAAAALVGVRNLALRRARLTLAVAGAGGVCLGSALLGHSGGASGWFSTRALADAAHLAAAATWSGLLIVALVVVVPALRGGAESAASARAVLRGFGVPAAACVSVIVVTGVYLTSDVVGSVDAGLRTLYGRTLIVKVTVVAIVGVLGLVNSRRLRGHRTHRSAPRGTVAVEAVLAVVVLGLAAVLTSGQPAREPQFVAASAPGVVPVVDTGVADLQESLALRPNRPGPNVALVDVHDTRRPSPAPVRRVLVSLVGLDGQASAPVLADRIGDGRWSAALVSSQPGRTQVRVTVQRPGMPDATHVYRWTVGGAPQRTKPAWVSTAPIGSTLRTWSLVLAVLLALCWGAAAALRQASRRPRPATEAVEAGRSETEELVGVS